MTRTRLLLCAIVVAVGASPLAAPATAAPGPLRVVVQGDPVQVTSARVGEDRCGRPAPTALAAASSASVTETADGLVVGAFREHVDGGLSAAASLVRKDGQVRPLAQPGSLPCEQAEDGAVVWLPSVEADRTGRTYLASVLEVPQVAGAPFTPFTRTLRVATRDPGQSGFSAPVTVTPVGGFTITVELTVDPFVDRRVWLSWSEPINNNITGQQLRVSRSDDGGATWSTPVTVFRGLSAVESPFVPKLAVLGKDRLAIATTGGALGAVINQPAPAAPSRPMDVLVFTSSDAGRSWSGPVRALRVSGDRPDDQTDGEQLRFIPAVALAATDDGHLHLAADEYRAGAGAALLTARSTDGGLTWQAGPDLARTTADGGFFAFDLAGRRGGVLAAAWTRADDTSAALATQTFAAVTTSRDLAAGRGWSAPVAVGPVTDRRAARTSSFFLETTELAVTRKGFAVAHPTTVADRGSGPDLQVLVTRIAVRR